ncbi:MAG: hydrogen gas-evolving membrane-bound hydrogenase subunit E [Thermodesulfobacteriota bacterium]|nr:hydrogen gas-evolving membrane-bound hydrogenase subunit E [Thermodesulfobacteriota bacterium]
MRILSLLTVVLTGALLLYGTLDMPDWSDPESPASRHVSPRYITKSIEETATPNVVTSVLADYRGYDTLGETTVIFSAGMACILILRRKLK